MTAPARPFLIEDVVVGPPAAAPSAHLEPTAKRVRCFLGGTAVADSTHAMLCFETSRLAVYYFPLQDVRPGVLVRRGRTYESTLKGTADYFDVMTDGAAATEAAWEYRDPIPGAAAATRYVAFHWGLMDAWFEEDEEVFIHPRDPHHRIDVLQSSRRIEVSIKGQVIARSQRPRMLFETDLPTRYYLSREDVHLDLLQPSTTRTGCAYKGFTTEYWTFDGRDVAWSYATPSLEVSRIAGMIAFFNERVDLTVDGSQQPRPVNHWS